MNSQTANKWGLFAGLVMVLIGAFHVLEGLVGLSAPTRRFLTESGMLLPDVENWGVVLLIWGVVMIVGGTLCLVGARWARVVAYTLAVLNALGQLVWLGQVLWLSVSMMVASLVVIGCLVIAGRASVNSDVRAAA